MYTVSELEAAFPPIAGNINRYRIAKFSIRKRLGTQRNIRSGNYTSSQRETSVGRTTFNVRGPIVTLQILERLKQLSIRKTLGGFSGYGFKCMHSHCADKTGKDLVDHLGVSIDVAVDKAKAAVNDISSLQKAIARAESRAELVSEIIPLILRAKLEPLEIGLLETPIQLKIQSLEGSRPKIKDVRQLLNPIRTYEGGSAVRVIPEWAQKWGIRLCFSEVHSARHAANVRQNKL